MFDESPSEAWARRYGTEPPLLPDTKAFLNHRSVRSFNEEPIPRETIQGLVAAAQSASTSSNLQMFSLITVQDPERRARVAELCAEQKQVRTAAWFFVFCADHHRIRQAAAMHEHEPSGLPYVEMQLVATIDAALAAERMVCAAESLGIGACYIGAARNHPREMAEFLGLPTGVVALFGLCLGFPKRLGAIKPRLSQAAVWFEETYPQEDLPIQEYDERMAAFYAEQNMTRESRWSLRSAIRCDDRHLDGREGWKEFLEERGFGVR